MFLRGIKYLLLISALLIGVYGTGRVYYGLTAGFALGKIQSDLSYDARWEMSPLNPSDQEQLSSILSQEYTYLGRGCQSYVFESRDGQYVIKFFKFYHFRPAAWLSYVSWVPGVQNFIAKKAVAKKQLLDTVFTSWKIAYDDLKPETGVVYIHLNKTYDLNRNLTLVDKLGFKHPIPIDQYEFMIQRKARLLGPVIDEYMGRGDVQGAKALLDKLMGMIFSEFKRGYADNDHALMQTPAY